jgi:PAS domain S-box-containing protein
MRLSTRLMLAMVALVFFTAATTGLLSYQSILAVSLPRGLDSIDNHVSLLASELRRSAAAARTDVSSFRYAIGLAQIMNATQRDDRISNGLTLTQWRERLARRMKAQLDSETSYLQFRIIGIADGGREIIKVERNEPAGPVRIVPDAELQTKGDRSYFLKTIARSPDAVEVSAIELAQEHGAIVKPHVPVLRVSAPVFQTDGHLFGIVIINVDLRKAFDNIRAAARPNARLYVVNEHGDYLIHPDPSREFAFEFGRSSKIQSDFPELADELEAGEMNAAVIEDKGGDRFGVGMAAVTLAGGPRAMIIEAMPYDTILASTRAVRNSSLIVALGAALLAILLAAIMARSLTKPLRQMTTAIEGFTRGETPVIPKGASGEVGTLARAFEHMSADVRAKTAALEHEIEERQRIFDTSLDLILITDKKGIYLRVSPAAKSILGFDPTEMVGHSAIDFIHPDDLESTRAEMRASRRGLLTRSFDCRYMHKDGHPVSLAWAGVWSEPEQKHFFIGRDMTERNKLEQQLRQSQKMDAIGQLTGGVAHDFNNILTVITSTIEVLSEHVREKPQLAAITKLIDEAAERGAELTRRLLAFARRQPLEPRDTDINALVRDTEKLVRPLLGAPIDIEVALAQDTWRAMVDPGQLSTALINLTVNARDAMPNGGKLTIETKNVLLDDDYASMNSEVAPGPYTLIAVSDTGTGIPAPILDKVFEPFFTTKGAGEGTGLGLSMVYGFVKQSGGHIQIYSEDGHGTTVKIYLPRASGTDERQMLPLAPTQIQRGNETILVVEDDPLVRNNLVAQLRGLGYTAYATANGQEALAVLEGGTHIDLLLTDVVMPGGLNGRELADKVSQRWPGIGILYTSGYTEDAIVHHGRLDPGVRLLAKPYRRADLARMVRIALEARSASAASEVS